MPLSPDPVTPRAVTLLKREDYHAMPWKDGGGTTREIARAPSPAAANARAAAAGGLAQTSFDWRVSIADIAAAGPFSRFDGYDRTLLLVNGSLMVLEIEGQPDAELRRYERRDFPGEALVRCRLPAGPVQDFNVMAARGRATATTELLRPGPIPASLGTRASVLLLHCRDGAAMVGVDGRTIALDDGDSLRVDTPAGASAGAGSGRVSVAAAHATAPTLIVVHIRAIAIDPVAMAAPESRP